MFAGCIAAFRDAPARATQAAFSILLDSRIGLFELTAELINNGEMPPQLDARIRELAVRRFNVHAETEQLPDPANRVTIDWTDRDSAGQPRIQMHYAIGDYERRGLAHGAESLRRIAHQLGANRLTISDVVTSQHATGTLRMGADPKRS